MLRFVLLIALPLAALCQLTPEQEENLRYMEERIKPCILHKLNCPPDGSMDYSKFASTIQNLDRLRVPQECKCDLTKEACNRQCYYAYVLKMHLMNAAEGKTDPTEIANAQSLVREQMESFYKPCIMENKNCAILGGLEYSRIVAEVANFVKYYSLPDECNCDMDQESCVRQCYYAFMLKSVLTPPSKRHA